MKTFLITGAAGFIGSNLVRGLLARGERVVGVDNFLTGRRENLEGLSGDWTFREGDIRDPETMRELCEGADFVLHHAALASVPWSVEEPLLAHEHNVTGTLNILLAARDAGVKKVVAAVTSAAYGDLEELPSRETGPVQPMSPYAATKLMDELYYDLFTRIYELPCIGLRYFNVFGPRQDPGSAYAAAIPKFVQKLLRGEQPTIFGDGEQSRDFVFVEDVLRANLAACEAGPGADGRVFNIGTGQRVTVNDLCAEIARLLEVEANPIHGPERAGDVRHSLADISLAKEHLGFEPAFTVASGLERAIGWYRENLG